MEPTISLTVKVNVVTADEYSEGISAVSSLRIPAWTGAVRSILSVLFGVSLGFAIVVNGASLLLIPACFLAALLALAAFKARLLRRSLLASYAQNFPLEITIDGNGLRSVGNCSDGNYEWAWFDGWRDCKSVVVAYSLGGGVFFFPKRELSGDVDALKTILHRNIAGKL